MSKKSHERYLRLCLGALSGTMEPYATVAREAAWALIDGGKTRITAKSLDHYIPLLSAALHSPEVEIQANARKLLRRMAEVMSAKTQSSLSRINETLASCIQGTDRHLQQCKVEEK
mmetsp:Transcript_22770/g.44407  ORF Transcript_22770/g.44407 Transcript_22770/m.44407 type:complete len:116 (+) Transcript_22770:348-695(+)